MGRERITPEHWRRMTGVFHAARRLDPSVRAGFVETACEGDRELQAAVLRLLEHDVLAARDWPAIEDEEPAGDASPADGAGSAPPGRARSPLEVTLSVVDGPSRGLDFHFRGHDTFIVGRSKYAHFRLPKTDKAFSRYHLMVEVNPPSCRVMDMASTNGTFVNGRRVVIADLKDGDMVMGGRTKLKVSVRPVAEEGEEADSPADTLAPNHLARIREGESAFGGCEPVFVESRTDFDELSRAEPRTSAITEAHLVSSPVEPAPLEIPGYRIVRKLGEGGTGVVYLAWSAELEVQVALKVVTPAAAQTPGAIARFLREASLLRQLDHPRIVKFRAMGYFQGRLFFAMDLVRGVTAAALVEDQGPLPVGLAVALIEQVLDGLAHAHGRGVVHRDLSPRNILIEQAQKSPEVRITDFGLARVYLNSTLSGLTMADYRGLGTLGFMPPEQITAFREALPATDQYAAAATLYYLLTGQLTYDFPVGLQQKLLTVLQTEPVPIRDRRRDIPVTLAEVIHRALSRDPDRRFPDVLALRQALAKCSL